MTTILIVLPAATALLIAGGLPRASASTVRLVALLGSLATLALALSLAATLDRSLPAEMPQLVEARPWVPSLGISWTVGADLLSAPLICLAAAVTVAAILVGWRSVATGVVAVHATILLAEAASLGIFLARDPILVSMFWQGAMVLVGLLVATGTRGRGASDRDATAPLGMAPRALTVTFAGSLIALVGVTALRGMVPGGADAAGRNAAGPLVVAAAGCLLAAGIVPLLGGFPRIVADAPRPAAMLIVGVLLPAGAHVLHRVAMALPSGAPAGMAGEIEPLLAAFGLLAIGLGAAGLALGVDIERALARAGFGAAGWLVLGIAAARAADVEGMEAVCGAREISILATSLGLSAAALVFLGDAVAEGRRSRRLTAGGDLPALSRRLAVSLGAASLALVGMPPSGAFIGKLSVLRDAWRWHPVVATAAAAGLAFEAFAIVRFLGRALRRPPGAPRTAEAAGRGGIADLDGAETAAAVGLLALVVIVGLFASRIGSATAEGPFAAQPLPVPAPALALAPTAVTR